MVDPTEESSSSYSKLVIGILSHPCEKSNDPSGPSFIPVQYVKFIKSAGASTEEKEKGSTGSSTEKKAKKPAGASAKEQEKESAGPDVIPLIFNESEDILNQKLNLVDCVLFTGGWQFRNKGVYYDTVKKIFKRIKKINYPEEGERRHLPLFAICLGFELLCTIIREEEMIKESKEKTKLQQEVIKVDILERFKKDKKGGFRLQFRGRQGTEDPESVRQDKDPFAGTMFERKDAREKLEQQPIAVHVHERGVSLETFEERTELAKTLGKRSELSEFFQILTTTEYKDEKKKNYVSTVKAWNYPMFGFQWHPEKEAKGNDVKPEDVAYVRKKVGDFFISEAKKSSAYRRPVQGVRFKFIEDYPIYREKDGSRKVYIL